MGTRLLPASKGVPKEMLPVADKPLIHYAIAEAVAAGMEQIVLVINASKQAIVDYFEPSPELESLLERNHDFAMLQLLRDIRPRAELSFVYQEQALGLGHAVLCARQEIGDEPFAVLLPDNIVDAEIPCIRQLIEVYDQYGGSVIAVGEVAPENVSRFGMVVGERVMDWRGARPLWRIHGLVEKPRASNSHSGIYGRYFFPAEILSHIESSSAGVLGEIQLTDAIHSYQRQGKPVYGCTFEGRHFDAGDKLSYLSANVAYGLKHPAMGHEFRSFLEAELAARPNVPSRQRAAQQARRNRLRVSPTATD